MSQVKSVVLAACAAEMAWGELFELHECREALEMDIRYSRALEATCLLIDLKVQQARGWPPLHAETLALDLLKRVEDAA